MTSTRPSFSVIVCAYTLQRWELLALAVTSVQQQSLVPTQIIVCVDHNPELVAAAAEAWAGSDSVTVVENRYPGRLGSARNTAVELATADVVAFLDDDAQAPGDWLERIAAVYESEPGAQAVGGGPRPRFESPRPAWFPLEFDWVFGCVYRGLPTERGHFGRLIGACMSARREAIIGVGGFHSDNHDDMDLSQRLIHHYGMDSVVFDPEIEVSHFVSTDRLTWDYFWHRCFSVNKGKVLAFHDMEEAGNQSADVAFVSRLLTSYLPGYLLRPVGGGWLRALAAVAGIGLAALGNAVGRVDLARGRTEPSATRGLELPGPEQPGGGH